MCVCGVIAVAAAALIGKNYIAIYQSTQNGVLVHSHAHTHTCGCDQTKPNPIYTLTTEQERNRERESKTSNIGFIMPVDIFGHFLSILNPEIKEEHIIQSQLKKMSFCSELNQIDQFNFVWA